MATTAKRKPLEYYLSLKYPMHVIADDVTDSYVVMFPDLPGCMTQVDSLDELAEMAEEARILWIETEYEDGDPIPLPSYPPEYSGKFNLRIPRSLHQRLAESAEREGVSLNQYVTSLLAENNAYRRVEQRIDEMKVASPIA